MLRVTVLASGSKGNCTVVTTSSTRIVVDAGLSCREIIRRMRICGEDPEKLDAVLLTHEHQDHVQGLSVLARRWNVPVYATGATLAAWKRAVTPRNTIGFKAWLETRRRQAELPSDGEDRRAPHPDVLYQESSVPAQTAATDPDTFNSGPIHPALLECGSEELASDSASDDPAYLPCIEYFRAGFSFQVGDVTVTPFTIPHDAADPVGFILQAEGLRIAIATDLGYMPPNVRMHLRGADLLMIESNHDVEMLRDGPYPWAVKQRVLSRVGHLSNDTVGDYLTGEYDGGARFVVLAHISESNNLPELARLSAERALDGRMSLLANKVLLASQATPLESIYL